MPKSGGKKLLWEEVCLRAVRRHDDTGDCADTFPCDDAGERRCKRLHLQLGGSDRQVGSARVQSLMVFLCNT